MKELQDRIITFVTKSNGLVSMNKLVAVASAAAFSESEVLQALSTIGSKLKSTVRGGVVYYQVPPPKKAPTDHLAWVRQWYKDNPYHCTEVPFPEISYAHLFLKTREERDLFISEMKGRPMMYNKKRYEHHA